MLDIDWFKYFIRSIKRKYIDLSKLDEYLECYDKAIKAKEARNGQFGLNEDDFKDLKYNYDQVVDFTIEWSKTQEAEVTDCHSVRDGSSTECWCREVWVINRTGRTWFDCIVGGGLKTEDEAIEFYNKHNERLKDK